MRFERVIVHVSSAPCGSAKLPHPLSVSTPSHGFEVRASLERPEALDGLLEHCDLQYAVREALLGGGVDGEGVLPRIVERRRNRRSREVGTGVALVVVVSGPAEWDVSRVSLRRDRFAFGFDLIDEDCLKMRTDGIVRALVASVSLASPARSAFSLVDDSICLFGGDGTPHYSSNPRVSPVSVVTSWSTENTTHAESTASDLGHIPAGDTLLRAVVLGLSEEHDEFKAFVLAFNAVEMLIGKTYAKVEPRFWSSLATPNGAVALGRPVRKNESNLVVKFAVVAQVVAPAVSTARDVEEFQALRELRNKLMHQADTPPAFPVEATRAVLRKVFAFYRQAAGQTPRTSA